MEMCKKKCDFVTWYPRYISDILDTHDYPDEFLDIAEKWFSDITCGFWDAPGLQELFHKDKEFRYMFGIFDTCPMCHTPGYSNSEVHICTTCGNTLCNACNDNCTECLNSSF